MAGSHRAIGLMSGTSMDGIDIAAVETDGVSLTWRGPAHTSAYPAALRDRLADAVRHPDRPAAELQALENDLTDAHAAAVEAFIPLLPQDRRAIDLVGFHGHTLFHRPDRQATRQLGDGQRLADRLALPVVFDFRSADMVAGGEGAPFAPAFHQVITRDLEKPVAVFNIGGVGNVTWIGADGLMAFDTGPGNGLIDDWVSTRTGQPYDSDGALAAAGQVDGDRLSALLDHPYFDRAPPKSLDRLDFSLQPVDGLSVADGAATLTAFTARSLARSIDWLPAPPRRCLVTGGGRHNRFLMHLLSALLAVPVDPVEAIGQDGDAIEAQAFAFLAVRARLGMPTSFPGTTGARHPVCGGRLAQPQTKGAA